MTELSGPRTGVAERQSYAPFQPKVVFAFSPVVAAEYPVEFSGTTKIASFAHARTRTISNVDLLFSETEDFKPKSVAPESAPLSEYQWSGPGRHEPYKRAFDLAVSVTLLIVLAPLLLLFCVAIKLHDSGPILVRHQRVGRFGQIFDVLKFRTDPARTVSAMPFGKFLEKSSIDELPQLLNVVRGELSLVGPRPITVPELPDYGLDVIYYLRTRPGITGVWRTNAQPSSAGAQRSALDCEYARNRNFTTDMKVLLSAISKVISGRTVA